MRFLQFVKWWWAKNDAFNRSVAVFLLFTVIPMAVVAIWFGADAIWIALINAGIIAAYWFIYGIFQWARKMYIEFIDEVPPEDEEIVRRLKGVPPRRNVEYKDYL